MVAGLVVLIVLQVLSVIANISMVGKKREPTTPALVAVSTILSMFIIAFYVALIYVLGSHNG